MALARLSCLAQVSLTKDVLTPSNIFLLAVLANYDCAVDTEWTVLHKASKLEQDRMYISKPVL